MPIAHVLYRVLDKVTGGSLAGPFIPWQSSWGRLHNHMDTLAKKMWDRLEGHGYLDKVAVGKSFWPLRTLAK